MTTIAKAAPASNSAPNTAGAKAAVEYKDALSIALIDADPDNRKDHDKDALQALADQIKSDGLLQPILVRPHPKAKDRYMIIAGERRWLAHKINKASTIRAFVHLSESEATAATKQVIENLGREDLDPMEEARQLKRLADLGKTQVEIGKLVRNKSQSAVANTLKLLQLPAPVQKIIASGGISAAHGQELVRFAAWPKACTLMAELVAKNNANESEEFINAKWLRDDELPFDREITRKGLAVAIYIGNYSYDQRKQYKISDALGKQPGFFKSGYEEWHYILPEDPKAANLWEPERVKQDKEREAKAKQKVATEERTQSKLSPAERAKRAKKIADNKQNRAESELGLQATFDHLRTLKTIERSIVTAMVAKVLSDSHYAGELKEAADKIGLKIPAGLVTSSWYTKVSIGKLATMSEVDQLRLAAAGVALFHGTQDIKFAHPIGDEIIAVIGAKKTDALKKQAKATLAAVAAAKAAKKKGGK